MIDTDKYEGHSEEDGWKVIYPDWLDRMCVATGEALYRPHCATREIEARVANMKLMADAPLLLAEVKRLQRYEREHKELWDIIANFSPQDSEADEDIHRQWLESVSQGYMGSVYEYIMMKQEEMIE